MKSFRMSQDQRVLYLIFALGRKFKSLAHTKSCKACYFFYYSTLAWSTGFAHLDIEIDSLILYHIFPFNKCMTSL